jgi:5-methylcytosine-specific restriction endonuclease McrBC regulatory subunit McrC
MTGYKENVIEIYDNSQIAITQEEINFLENFKKQYRLKYSEELSFKIKKDKDSSYFIPNTCVGLIKTPYRTIIIKPRFHVFNLDTIIKMWIYTKSTNPFDKENDLSLFSLNYERFIPQVIRMILESINEIIKKGVAGHYIEKSDALFLVKGKPVIQKSLTSYQTQRKLFCEYDDFTIDNILNQILLYVLQKIKKMQSHDMIEEVNRLIIAFQAVSHKPHINHVDFILAWSKITRLNIYYKKALRLCEIFVLNLFINDISNDKEWQGFLTQYDILFEDYTRKLLSNSIHKNVIKWKQPKLFAKAEGNQATLEKEKKYQPDILVNYMEELDKCDYVIDIKNKYEKYFSNSDIYQLLFYCIMLKTRVGILVYPIERDKEKISLEIKLPNYEGSFWLFTIFNNLSNNANSFWKNQEKFIEEINILTGG